MQVLKWGLYRL